MSKPELIRRDALTLMAKRLGIQHKIANYEKPSPKYGMWDVNGRFFEDRINRALINPDKNKFDYDDKIVSVHYESGYNSGDVFEWMGTDTYWLIYLQDIDELAYFRGEIRKCSYTIAWQDEDGLHSSYAAVRGPVETKINFI